MCEGMDVSSGSTRTPSGVQSGLAMPENRFDEWVAQRYEILWPEIYQPSFVDPSVELLAELAGPGPAMEFGIGTGRVALPLSRRGVQVHGIEISSAMVTRLKEQPGGADILVTTGNFADTAVDVRFSLVFLIRNTITNV